MRPFDAYNTGELQIEGDIGIAQYLLFVFEQVRTFFSDLTPAPAP